MPPKTSANAARIAQQTEAWGFRQLGWTQARIAERIGVDQSTVCRWLDTVEKRELRRLSKQVGRQKATQTAWLETIFDEAMQAWERSKTPRKKSSKKRSGTPGKDAKALDVITSDVTGRDGDPVHLATAMTAAREIRKIWGLEPTTSATKKDKAAGVAGFAERLAALKANAAKYDAAE